MAAQNEPNFALFTSSHLDFLTDELYDTLLVSLVLFYVFRARIMQSIQCKMDFEN